MLLSVIKSIFNFQSHTIIVQCKHFVAFYKFQNVYICHIPFNFHGFFVKFIAYMFSMRITPYNEDYVNDKSLQHFHENGKDLY